MREAEDDEWPAVAQLLERGLAEYRAIADPNVYAAYVAYALDRSHRAGGVQLVAEVAHQALGTVTFFRRASPRAPTWPRSAATFQTLAVDPAARRQGVGGTLVMACIERAVTAGASGLVIETLPFMVSAMPLYEQFRFARWPDGDWEASGLLADLLGRPDAPRLTVKALRLDFPRPGFRGPRNNRRTP
ncbi:MAG TPA: GNAT family N-acetyltransferase [Candidatus Limnocylindrales bacterium]